MIVRLITCITLNIANTSSTNRFYNYRNRFYELAKSIKIAGTIERVTPRKTTRKYNESLKYCLCLYICMKNIALW